MTMTSDVCSADFAEEYGTVINEAIVFPKNISFFSFLDEEALMNVAAGSLMAIYPKGQVIM